MVQPLHRRRTLLPCSVEPIIPGCDFICCGSSLMDHTHIPTALNGAQWALRASSHHQQILCAAATEQVLHHGTEMGNALLELLRPVEAEADAKRLCCGRRSV
jgi:hypothetical protein